MWSKRFWRSDPGVSRRFGLGASRSRPDAITNIFLVDTQNELFYHSQKK